MTWREQLDKVRADPAAVEIALALHVIVNGHMPHCHHKKRCPEQIMLDEADRIIAFAREQDK